MYCIHILVLVRVPHGTHTIYNKKKWYQVMCQTKLCVDWLKLCYAIVMKKRQRMIIVMMMVAIEKGKNIHDSMKIEHAAYRYNCKLQFWFLSGKIGRKKDQVKGSQKNVGESSSSNSNTLHVTCKLSSLLTGSNASKH